MGFRRNQTVGGRTWLSGTGGACQGEAARLLGFIGPEIPVPAVESRLRPLLAHGGLEDGLKLSKIVELNLAGVQR